MVAAGIFSQGTKDGGLRHASTVLLLRPVDGGFEAVLQKRARASHFMGGAHVFPGGKLDAADASEAVLSRLLPGAVETCAARLNPTPGTELAPEIAAGLYVAGCRETFEEAGVLLACGRDGQTVDVSKNRDLVSALAEARASLLAEKLSFAEVLSAHDLYLDVGNLHYWAHWVTPSLEPRRFDTRFFVACLPPGQEAECDGCESTELVWHSPNKALQFHEIGSMFLPPPTQRNLQELMEFDDLESVYASALARPISAIMPRLIMAEGKITIVLPWDPDYEAAQGDALPGDAPVDPCPHLDSRIELVTPTS